MLTWQKHNLIGMFQFNFIRPTDNLVGWLGLLFWPPCMIDAGCQLRWIWRDHPACQSVTAQPGLTIHSCTRHLLPCTNTQNNRDIICNGRQPWHRTTGCKVRDRAMFKLVVWIHRCINGRAPQYLAVHCVPLSSQRHLRYAERNLLHAPRHRLNTYIRPLWAFCHRWSVRLEQSSGPCPQSELHWSCFQAPDKDISVYTVLAHLSY